MRFASLGSGSRGNALIIDAGETKLLLDCGFSTRSTIQRLSRLGVQPEEISALLVTHEHSDHSAGVFKFARRFACTVYLTHGTYLAMASEKEPDCHLIDSCNSFAIGGIEVQPFPVPHDAREPVQFRFFDGVFRLGVLTDAGSVTQHIVDVLSVCDALVLEFNHDQGLLAASDYPMALKRRISGGFGHLENAQAIALLSKIDTGRLQYLVAAHLSAQNNCRKRVADMLSSEFECSASQFDVASQDEGFGWKLLV